MSKLSDSRAKTSVSSSGENLRSKPENIESTSSISSPNIGKTKTTTVPRTKIYGVLQELKDDIVNESPYNTRTRDYIYHISTSGVTPKTGLSDFYVEQNGRFIKASKDISERDMDNGLRYFQSLNPEISYKTPLDMAIYTQQVWNVISKILFGILAGFALFDLIIIHYQLDITKSWEQNGKFLELYSSISFLVVKSYHIILTICLITLLDWFDIAHMNPQHLADTFQFRKVWIVTFIYFIALLVVMYNFSSDDMMILYDNNKDNYLKDNKNTDFILYLWMVAKKICCWCCIIGWVILVITNNEDLFLIHLVAMKKYDYDEDQVNRVYENVNAIP